LIIPAPRVSPSRKSFRKVIDEIAETGVPLIVTKHGTPVVEERPIPRAAKTIAEFPCGRGEIVGDILASVGVAWEANA